MAIIAVFNSLSFCYEFSVSKAQEFQCPMELSCLSAAGSYSLNDRWTSNGNTSCTCTRFSYNRHVTSDTTYTPLPRPSTLPIPDKPEKRVEAEEQIRGPRLEPNSDLFGIQLEVTAHLLEAEKRKLHVLQRELGQLRTEDHNHNISDLKNRLKGCQYPISREHQVEYLRDSISHIQQQHDQLEREYHIAALQAMRIKQAQLASRSQPAIGLKQTPKARVSNST